MPFDPSMLKEARTSLIYYKDKGGLVGILNSASRKLADAQRELLREANMLWKTVFPRSRFVFRSVTRIPRTIGIFVRFARERGYSNLIPRFREIARKARLFDEKRYLITRLRRLNDTLRRDYSAGKYIISKIHNIAYNATSILDSLRELVDLDEEYYLSQLFLQHRSILYASYEGKKSRHVNYIFESYVHAELLYIEEYVFVEAFGPLGWVEREILVEYAQSCDYAVIYFIAISLDFGIDLSNMKVDFGYRDREAYLVTEDIDYNVTREDYPARLPWNWPELNPGYIVHKIFGITPYVEVQKKLPEFIQKRIGELGRRQKEKIKKA